MNYTETIDRRDEHDEVERRLLLRALIAESCRRSVYWHSLPETTPSVKRLRDETKFLRYWERKRKA